MIIINADGWLFAIHLHYYDAEKNNETTRMEE